MADRKERYERRQRNRERRQGESRRAHRQNRQGPILMVAGGVAVLVLVIGGFGLFMAKSSTFGKELPPTGFSPAHLESLPSRQINTRPIPRLEQEHLMERGGEHLKGRMLVQYNCRTYQCEGDLVDRLTEIVEGYPSTVYLAPYPTMDAKIALAAPGRLVTLDAFEEERMKSFINGNLDR